METIPLFPLRAVLFPKGRMPLQIFEPRYLELIKKSLKENKGFGVAWLRQGDEVSDEHSQHSTKLADVGTYANIVDWYSKENGLLGVVIEGQKKFRLQRSYQQQDLLWMGEVEWITPEPVIPLPDDTNELRGLLMQLVEHPHVAALGIEKHIEDVESFLKELK